MASIIEQFSKKNGKLPPLPQVVETPMPASERHAQALEFVGGLAEENARLEAENRQLRQDGALALMRIRDLEREATLRFGELETNRRYAVEVQTHLQHVLDAATHAHHCAVNAAEAPLQPMPDAAVKEAVAAVETELNAVKAGGDSG